MRYFMHKFGLLAAVGMAFCGCSKSQPTQTTADAAVQVEALENAESATDSACNREFTANATRELWSAANNAFGFEMLKSTKPGDSVVVSPYSVERAMGMLLDGACGNTAVEIQKALKLPDADNNSKVGAEIEAEMLNTFDETHTIDIDNHLWIQQSYEIRNSYIDLMKQHYAATPENVDFAGATDEARKYINDFIAKATHDKIKEILPANAVTSLTRLILTNAVYFKGPWRNTFNESATTKENFRIAGGTQQVDMMHHTASHAVYEAEQFVAFDMDFAAANYTLMIILPKADENTDVAAALADIEKGFSSIVFKQVRSQMMPEQVALNMPKFKVEYGASLKGLLMQLGVQSAFTSPDFSLITGNRELYLSDVLHKAFIDVNENGAEAAAATAVVMKLRSAMPMRNPRTITVDHPFLFAIVEKSTQTALFLGRVTKI